ncbi:MAG: hypothetical protein AMK72_01010 [Planctomycetes bacterium SM23_25]|nr:MAG: hypothetical protein AMS14_00680 [Planctomycetes bacterium DG_20]KPK50913.1 MAG: hypothetical protein AMK72_01010 [Planctomycetes bacterium SM23_25]
MRTVHKGAADRPGVTIFQQRAGHYDAWFGSARGQAIFESEARFFSPDELGRLAHEAGLHLRGAACTLLQNPQDEVILVQPARDGLAEKAGFVSLLYGGQSDSHAGGVGAEAP